MHRFTILFGLLALLCGSAAAQQLPFQLQFTQGGSTTTIGNNSTLALVAAAGQVQTLQVRAVYTGTGQISITQPPSVVGSSALSASLDQSLPIALSPSGSFTFTIRYAPANSAIVAAQLSLSFSETPSTDAPPITLALQGLSSALVLSYVLPADQNVVPVTNGDTIPFPDTLVGGAAQAALGITNLGSGPGQVSAISISGAAFKLQGVPLLPAALLSGQSLQVQVVYRPTAQAADSGSLTVQFAGAAPVTLQLSGRGVAPVLQYQVVDPATDVPPGGTIQWPNTELGQTTTRLLRVRNNGTAPATLSQLSISGQGFQIGSTTLLPFVLQPGASTVLSLTFTPTRTGLHSGALVVNSDVLNLNGSGLAAQLIFSYSIAGTTINLSTGEAIVFSPVQVSKSAQIVLSIRNIGNSAAPVANLGISTIGSAFAVPNPPALPLSIAPNTTLDVGIRFEPVTIGFTNANFTLNGTTIPLTGSGTAPPTLPAYTFSGPTGSVAPFTQSSLGLRLAATYPVAIIGSLTLNTATGALPADPAVQFATGGRSINFQIPANSTDAIFGATPSQPVGTQIGLQTGTVAGSFTVTPTFETQAGNIDLTPQNTISQQFTVAAAAPSLIAVRITTATATALTVQVTGFTTTRSLSSLQIEFVTKSGFKMPTSQFSFTLSQLATSWFQSAGSQTFGGQFTISVPFTFDLPVDQSILNGIASVSATVSNSTGVSQPLAAQLQ